ncbi:hypothetical protein D3C81_1489130 [compost metagenome]
MIDHLVLVHRWRRQEHEQVMSLLCRHFGRRARGQRGDADVVDHHLGIVLLAPLFHVGVVEPLVVARHEMVPLQDLQRALRRVGIARDHERPEAGGKPDRAGGPDQCAPAVVGIRIGAGGGCPVGSTWMRCLGHSDLLVRESGRLPSRSSNDLPDPLKRRPHFMNRESRNTS